MCRVMVRPWCCCTPRCVTGACGTRSGRCWPPPDTGWSGATSGGFGDSPMADRPYGDAGDVMDLLDHLGIERAALVGASHGGQVALEIAATRPDAVTARVLLCSALPGHEPGAALRSFAEQEEALFDAGDL